MEVRHAEFIHRRGFSDSEGAFAGVAERLEDGVGAGASDGRAADPEEERVEPVVGPELRRFESLLCWFLRCEGGCQGYVDHLWNGLTSLELARVLGDIIEGDIRPGVRHLYSEDVICL